MPVAAIPNVPASFEEPASGRGDWQSMRRRLFGERRQRAAEDRLLAELTELHTRLAAATREGAAALGPAARAAVLRHLNEGINRLLRWRSEQLQAFGADEPHAGSAALAAALALVQQRSPLFEAAAFAGDRLECDDVIQSIRALCGAESGRFFAEALAGLVALLQALVEELRRHPATSGVVAGSSEAFDALFGELHRLAPPPPAGTPAAMEDGAGDAEGGEAGEIAFASRPEPATRPARAPVYLELLRFAEDEAPALPEPAASPRTPARALGVPDRAYPALPEPAASPRTLAARLFAARFIRMEVVAKERWP